jgi:type II secretory pathway component PulF
MHSEELTPLVEAVGAAAASQIPIEVTLAALAEETNDPRLAEVAQQLASQLEHGIPMQQAIAGLDRQLPTEVATLLQSGIETGDLAGTLERFSRQRIESQRIRRRIQAAIAYPLIVAAILVPLTLFLSIYVIPMFKNIFEEFDFRLSNVTELILQAAEQLPQFIFGMLIFVLGVPLVIRFLGGRWLLHRVRSAIPVLGRLWLWSGQREFAAALASYIDLRVPLIAAVSQTGNTISDRNLGRACQRVSQRLENGETLADCLNQSIHFDRALVSLVAWGEKQGLLPEALALAIEVFDDRIEQYASLLRRILPPFTLILVVVVMFYVIVGLVVPLVPLIESLSR